ncbi:unnamed protein product, partial [Brenthis ino]
MDSSKYVIPKLPTTQNVLDDISDPIVLQLDKELKIIKMEDILNDAYRCYCNINKLKKDIHQQNDLNAKLEDLNKELVHNIENMKKQQ